MKNKYPLYCPKGKHTFHRAVDVAACNCLRPHARCAKLKSSVNDLLPILVGGAHVVVHIDNSHRGYGCCDVPGEDL